MQDPYQVRTGKIAALGKELMNSWNHQKTDPSLMAVCGHDTSTGYEFFIERDGETYVIFVTLDHHAE